MNRSRAFLEIDRIEKKYQPVDKRISHFNEFTIRHEKQTMELQASRCMDCGTPFCHAVGCPLGNLIPEWMEHACSGNWKRAYEILSLTSPFPEFTGRVCPALCESACTLAINSEPAAVQQMELEIIERAFDEGWVTAPPPAAETGRKAAVIGSGPAGLAAAAFLRQKGHRVTVFERDAEPGGLLRYGIPNFKLEKRIISRRIALMKESGIRFETGTEIGEDISAGYLRRSHDAVIIAAGAGVPRDVPAGGRGLEGIHFALDFLRRASAGAECPAYDPLSASGKRVLVIGGGDTGSDCVGTAVRQGAAEVLQYEIMPKPSEWKEAGNPAWPYRPAILRTSTSQQEGCKRDWSIRTAYFSGRNLAVEKAGFCRLEWRTDPRTGTPVMEDIPGSEFELDIDMVLIATGFLHVEHGRMLKELELETDRRGNIKTEHDGSTSVQGIFAAGDAATGASLAAKAAASGIAAARSACRFLAG